MWNATLPQTIEQTIPHGMCWASRSPLLKTLFFASSHSLRMRQDQARHPETTPSPSVLEIGESRGVTGLDQKKPERRADGGRDRKEDMRDAVEAKRNQVRSLVKGSDIGETPQEWYSSLLMKIKVTGEPGGHHHH
ncbi:hypothetical protein NDU88_010174 [Pleurodeles waltl]|uniref:Uncharacterized protein n=1 Tax=Pleurodeles waltl TaxID=8319 RepID=A0AAV7S0H6_PLEWA|nr:hypothetical protein NDU88_010174 [Pleurodeles waltl]